jgi:hypothetical protein
MASGSVVNCSRGEKAPAPREPQHQGAELERTGADDFRRDVVVRGAAPPRGVNRRETQAISAWRHAHRADHGVALQLLRRRDPLRDELAVRIEQRRPHRRELHVRLDRLGERDDADVRSVGCERRESGASQRQVAERA